jgi:large subunit ribosomal protein L23
VKVVDCTTMNVGGKMKRLRGKPGLTSSYKKAIVRVAPGEKIQAFEGV